MSSRTVYFEVDGDRCEADLYLPGGAAAGTPPIVVMAHGLAASRDMGLDAYAQRFAAAGYACLVFDYRHFGGSQGEPRQLLAPKKQLEDWAAAIEFARGVDGVDGDRVIAWGTSFGGGNAIATAAARPAGLVAAIAQCPFTSGIASTLALDPRTAVGATWAAVRDLIGSQVLRGAPHLIPTAGPPHSTALMTAPDAAPGFLALVPQPSTFRNEVTARSALGVLRYHPGRRVAGIEVPILFAVCESDSVAPARPTLRFAAKAPRGEIITYPEGHFEIYLGEPFERVVADQLAFLERTVPVSAA